MFSSSFISKTQLQKAPSFDCELREHSLLGFDCEVHRESTVLLGCSFSEQMATKKNKSLEIPDGWVLHTKVESDGTEVQSFLCPETEQEFSTYEKLMRYVRYAKAAKVSIYASDFWSSIPNEVASSKARKKRSSCQSSKLSVTKQGEESTEPAATEGRRLRSHGKKQK